MGRMSELDLDRQRLDFLEDWARRSPTGVSIDATEDGFRFMRHHHIGDPAKSAREAIDTEIASLKEDF